MRRLLTITFFSFTFVLSAQKCNIRGVIIDSENGYYIKGASISINNRYAKTDSTGTFSVFTEHRNSYKFEIKHEAYKKQIHNLRITSDTVITFIMQPIAVSLSEVVVQAEKDNSFGIARLNNIEGTTIFAGKKSEAVYPQDLNANLAANNSRQVFAKVAGINIFESDGSGTQIGIGGRGLNPNRISNFNTRQNGYDISADALGYPESYYTPPTEAIERIEILRGAAGLQFGTQFGGMINYKFSQAPQDKKISGNFRQTTGSFGFVNSFNQLTGTVKKISYNTFYQYKHYTGWRSHMELNSHNAFVSLKYKASDKLFLGAEYTFLNYLNQQPGGLTDKQFEADETQVTRKRNWFKVNWNLLALTADYKLSHKTRINLTAFGLNAGRDALGYLGRADRADDTSTYRNMLSDNYNNYGAELRLLRGYNFFGDYTSHFLIGARYYKGQTMRKQGNAGKLSSPDFIFLNPGNLENSAYTFPSSNCSLFAENIFQLSKKWSLVPGLRFEYIYTASKGYYRLINKNLAGTVLLDRTVSDSRSNTRSFLLAGLGTQYKMRGGLELYANFCQNYRAVNFNDMRVLNPNYQVDPQLKDENGFTTDAGLRGVVNNLLYFDLSVFMLQYNQRIGTTLVLDTTTYQIIRLRTNIGNSRNMGIESFAELDWMKLISKKIKHKLSTFVNFSAIDARYISNNKAYNNREVEYVPKVILRTGITYTFKNFTFTYQHSYTAKQYSDATNAESSPSAIYGAIPAYTVSDLSVGYIFKILGVHAGINNLTNNNYFTRRAEGYPGPGIIPADPRNFYITAKIKF